jgi:hypothetical protein
MALPDLSASGTPNPTAVTEYQTGFSPEIAPYGQAILGQGAALTNVNTNPYMQYTGDQVAQFTPLQQSSYKNAALMQTAPQLQQGTAVAGTVGQNALNTNYTYNPYQSQSFSSPGMAQSYMNPYVANVLNPQLQMLNQQQGAQQQVANAQATQAGAFGGSRFGVQNATSNLNNQLAQQNTIGQGLFNAYNQGAQQFNTEQGQNLNAAQLNAQQGQFGANLGLQGLNTALQSANTLGSLGNQQYNQNLGVIGLQNQLGGQQQQQTQNVLNNQYQNFLNAQNYPYQQLNFMSNLIRGLPMTQQSASVYQAPPSMLSQVAGLGLTAAGLGAFSSKAKGGAIEEKKSNGLADLALSKMEA